MERKVEHNDSGSMDEQTLQSRRDFLIGLGRWSKVVIRGAILAGALLYAERETEAGWVNTRGGGGGVGWVNAVGGGGVGWVNAVGGGGGGWVNRRGYGGSWINAR